MEKKRPNNNLGKGSTSEIRGLGALVEQTNHSVQAVAEQFLSLNEKIDSNFKEVKQTLQTHTEMIGQLMVDVTEVKNDLKQKVGIDQFARLEKRVARLEAKV